MTNHGVDVLAFAPHPDDAEIFCGGILIRCRDQGHSTGIVDLTRGERASRGTPEIRRREADRAGEILGLSFRENLGLPDAALDAGSLEQAAPIVEVIRRRRPAIVLLPWFEERHPDHVATAHLVTRAVFLAGLRKHETVPPSERFAPRHVLHYAMRFRMPPSFVVDTSAAWERKLEAIRAHESQVGAGDGRPATLIGSAMAIPAIEARDRYHGSLIGTSHGEALRSVATPGLVDLVKHLSDNPFTEPHAFEPLT